MQRVAPPPCVLQPHAPHRPHPQSHSVDGCYRAALELALPRCPIYDPGTKISPYGCSPSGSQSRAPTLIPPGQWPQECYPPSCGSSVNMHVHHTSLLLHNRVMRVAAGRRGSSQRVAKFTGTRSTSRAPRSTAVQRSTGRQVPTNGERGRGDCWPRVQLRVRYHVTRGQSEAHAEVQRESSEQTLEPRRGHSKFQGPVFWTLGEQPHPVNLRLQTKLERSALSPSRTPPWGASSRSSQGLSP